MNTATAAAGAANDIGVDVVVVTYQSEAWISPCLESVLRQEGIGRVVVADSASTDGTAARVRAFADRGVEWLATGANRGFGAAANRGIAATASPIVLLINPDLFVEDGAIAALRAALTADSGLGVVGPKVCDLDGTPYPSARSFPNLFDAAGHAFVGLISKKNPWSKRYLAPDRVEWVSGTAMLLRRSAFESVGGFDESYFMYVEDVDLCWRLRQNGFGAALAPAGVVRHAIGGSSESVPYRMIVAHHVSLWRFARRSTTGAARLFLPLVAVGLVARAGAVSVRRVMVRRAPAAQ